MNLPTSVRGGAMGLIALAAIGLLAACATPTRTTRLTIGDLNETTRRMVASLAASDLLAERGPDSPRMVIVINKVRNLTTDLIPPGEQWMWMAKVRGAMPVQELARRKNIVFQIAPERWPLLRDYGYDEDLGPTLEPTHAMWADFHSARRVARQRDDGGHVTATSDYYYLEYTIVDLDSREIQWSDRFEFQRQATGLAID